MPRTVSSSEAQNNNEYTEIVRLRQEERKRQALSAIRQARADVRAANQDLPAEEAYRLAGFSEEVIREALTADEQLKADN